MESLHPARHPELRLLLERRRYCREGTWVRDDVRVREDHDVHLFTEALKACPNGAVLPWGVGVLDDLAAGVYALLLLFAWETWGAS